MLRQHLEQKLLQKLSPAQIMVIKLLEVPTIELEERILRELEENPALEEGKDELSDASEDRSEADFDENNKENESDFDLDDYINEDDIPDYKLIANNRSLDDKHENIPFSAGKTFHEHLTEQVGLLNLDERQKKLVKYIIGNIDDEGYLRRDAESMVDDLVFQVGETVTDEEMEELIGVVQTMEPAGIGARDLRECLLLQLARKETTPTIDLAQKILEDLFEEFSRKHYDKIMRSQDIDEETLKEALDEIVRLNPKPGNALGGSMLEKTLSIIVPDFHIENDAGTLTVHLNNSNIPDLRINSTYSNMFADYAANKSNQTSEKKDALIFVKQKIDSARWFIDAIKQRQMTLLTTMNAIVNYQHDFFIEGDEMFLRPMVLKDIAEITGYDISTISRVSNSKYVQTEHGVFPVKYFFSEAMTNKSGKEISTREIKKVMQEIIADEDKRNPINDDKLVEALKKKGYVIARRTAAKYREQLNIPVARLRKEI